MCGLARRRGDEEAVCFPVAQSRPQSGQKEKRLQVVQSSSCAVKSSEQVRMYKAEECLLDDQKPE